MTSLLSQYAPATTATTAPQWIYVTRRFTSLLAEISLTDDQHADGIVKHTGATKCLNKHYWDVDTDSTNSMLIGSWGKSTRVRPPRDVDVLFILPTSVYHRFEQRAGNKQSQLLQEVKDVLLSTYSTTTRISGDGQVVVVPFNTFTVEVAPAFALQNGQYYICDTNVGGSYKTIDPVAEITRFDAANKAWNGNPRDLVRMLKQWQYENNVDIKSFHLEILSTEFIAQWACHGSSVFWYDWMVRDFFEYMKTRVNGFATLPGTGELISFGNAWQFRAESAHTRAIKACEYEQKNQDVYAAAEWQAIFGSAIQRVS